MNGPRESDRWEWNKEGEFFFRDAFGGVTGRRSEHGGTDSVSFDLSSGVRNARRIVILLWLFGSVFPGYELRVTLDRDVPPLLDELAAAGLIRWEDMGHPYSREARILELASPRPIEL